MGSPTIQESCRTPPLNPIPLLPDEPLVPLSTRAPRPVNVAAAIDLAALALVFRSCEADGKPHYDVLDRCYLNEAVVLDARYPSYPGCLRRVG